MTVLASFLPGIVNTMGKSSTATTALVHALSALIGLKAANRRLFYAPFLALHFSVYACPCIMHILIVP